MNLGSNNNNERKQFAFDLNVKPVEDDNSDLPENLDSCTICLEPLVNAQDDRRTLVTLICGHKFHLDCIGSAFNAKGFMQCPNCKQIEPGQWRYAANPPIQNIREGERIAVEEADDANSGWPTQSSVRRYFDRGLITAMEALEPVVMRGRQYRAQYPPFHHTPAIGNAPLLPPLPIPTTEEVNLFPSLFGNLSEPVLRAHISSSGRGQAGGVSHSWANLTYLRPGLSGSSSRGGGTSVNDGDGIGISSSDGGRGGGGTSVNGGDSINGVRSSNGGRGGNGDRNGMSGGRPS
ncbi:hypothetical protein N665_0062s0111 [Sinapis alba]|nr:hypothetical protein N665_0062s0111 [Sinapis alba]